MEANYRWPMLWGLVVSALGSVTEYFYGDHYSYWGMFFVLLLSQVVYFIVGRIKLVPLGHSFAGAIALLILSYVLYVCISQVLFYSGL